jgi:hypothetical protein
MLVNRLEESPMRWATFEGWRVGVVEVYENAAFRQSAGEMIYYSLRPLLPFGGYRFVAPFNIQRYWHIYCSGLAGS